MKIQKISVGRSVTLSLGSGTTTHIRPSVSVEVGVEDGDDPEQAFRRLCVLADKLLHHVMLQEYNVAFGAESEGDIGRYLTEYFSDPAKAEINMSDLASPRS